MSFVRQLQRHTIAAAASVALLTPGLTLLIRRGYLGELAPAGPPLRAAVLFALGLTFLIFLPLALGLEWVVDRARVPAAVAPAAVAMLFTLFWLGIETASHHFSPSFIPFYLTAGLLVAVAFCAYWIPLRFLRTRIPS